MGVDGDFAFNVIFVKKIDPAPFHHATAAGKTV
jgi:hypothetical protein